MPQYFKTLLLAVALSVTAHVKALTLATDAVTSSLSHPQGTRGVTNLLTKEAVNGAAATGHSLGNLDKTVAKRTPSSAVEDWSLVCQQLCGAALGGAECSPYCKNMPVLPLNEQLKIANNLLDSKKQDICPNLCGLQLGDDACTCKNVITEFDQHQSTLSETNDNATNVCAVFCDYRHVTLAGCSPCADAPAADNLMAIKPTVGVVALDAVVEQSATTTPNWNELCASLCKTGDGGSLCNCDLSPFFL